MNVEFPEYNIYLIDFQQIHKKYEVNLIDQLYNLDLIHRNFKTNKDIRRILTHYVFKETIDYIINNKFPSKPVVYFCKSQMYDSQLFEFIDEHIYLTILTSIFLKMKQLLPVKIVISYKSLQFFNELLSKNDGRSRGTLLKVKSAIEKFKIESFTFEKVKKFAKLNGLTFLSGDYFNDIKTKQIVFH